MVGGIEVGGYFIMWEFWIDTGGTFTDCLALSPDGEWKRAKVLSSSSIRGRVEGEQLAGNEVQVEFDGSFVEDFFIGFEFVHVASGNRIPVLWWDSAGNTLVLEKPVRFDMADGDLVLLQFSGEAPELAARWVTETAGDDELPESRLRLATTKGTNALLEGKGAKTVLFINKGLKDLLRINTQQRPDLFALDIQRPEPIHEAVIEVELDDSGRLIPDSIRESLEQLEEIDCAAVALMHAWKDGSNEKRLGELLKELGIKNSSLSHECAPFIKLLPRAETALVDATLSPILNSYLDSLSDAFGSYGLTVMTSAGGLVPREQFRPKDSLVSGPAGGVVGAVNIAKRAGYEKLIGFDMGGTSSDVARFDGDFEYQYVTRVGDVSVLAPSLKIETVAAGGGSICQFDGSRLRVGPESAGAEPGPACYGTGGPLTVTDVNVLLGRLDVEQFGLPVESERSRERLLELVELLKNETGEGVTEEQLLSGLLEIANENMADAIRTVSTAQGYDPSGYALVAFGGAGGQHACAIAEKLGIETLLFPGDAGLLSAYGLERAVLEGIAEQQLLCSLGEFEERSERLIEALSFEARLKFPEQERCKGELNRVLVGMRLSGQVSTLEVDFCADGNLAEQFGKQFQAMYGYTVDAAKVEVVSIRVILTIPKETAGIETFNTVKESTPIKFQQSFVNGAWSEIAVINRLDINIGSVVTGPAIVQDAFCTLFVDAGWSAIVGSEGTLKVEFSKHEEACGELSHAVELELFTNRFSTLVENMGYRLQRTALSTNVKERLDFSCALLDAEGELVVNAPHIPVHLGALGMCVRTLSENHAWKAGQMMVTNHPGYGGSHLPDVTVVSPIFSKDDALIGFLANRAHHAEMGGISPGSMPPGAKNLEEEGVVIPPTLLMENGVTDLDAVKALLVGAKYPSRRVEENLSDLNAQIAANLKGLEEFNSLEEQFGVPALSRYMAALKERAELSLRKLLEDLHDGVYSAKQYLDDGTPLCVTATVSGRTLSIDFEGSAPVHEANFNATPSIVSSAVIYFLRVWVNEAIPLNEGLMKPVTLKIPEGILNPLFVENPSECPPVVAGNVETSQRLVDTLFLAFEVAACSQGTMNNLIFGNEGMSFYETIAGGSGAGKGFDGESAVHVHMTNTGITDPEILEHHFPVKLREFSIRTASGGKGKYRGGDGVVRELEFTEAVTLSLLTQHRKEAPYGLNGGEAGALGEQWLIKANGDVKPLPGCTTVEVKKGERVRILTPGGGGVGASTEVKSQQ